MFYAENVLNAITIVYNKMLTCGVVFKSETACGLAQLPKSFLLKTERGVLFTQDREGCSQGGGGYQRDGGVFTQGWGGVGLGFHFTNFYFSGFQ